MMKIRIPPHSLVARGGIATVELAPRLNVGRERARLLAGSYGHVENADTSWIGLNGVPCGFM
jgi:hypothetical protein